MKRNLNNVDRIIRMVLAVIVTVLYLAGIIHGTAGTILLLVSAILLITSFISFCPLYYLMGISTNRKERVA